MLTHWMARTGDDNEEEGDCEYKYEYDDDDDTDSFVGGNQEEQRGVPHGHTHGVAMHAVHEGQLLF